MAETVETGEMIEVRGANLWHQITGSGEPVLQIHGSGFGHFNFGPATPILSQEFQLHRLRPAGLRAVREARAALRHRGLGRRRRRDARFAGDRASPHPRDLDGRNGGDRDGRQVPRASPVGGHQLRRREARVLRPAGVQELDRPDQARGLWQPGPRRADLVAVPVTRLHGDPGGPGRRRRDPADPARRQRGPGDDPGLPGDERHGSARVGAEDHLPGVGARRRRGRDDPMGPGTRREPGSSGSPTTCPTGRSTSSGAPTTRRSSTAPRSTAARSRTSSSATRCSHSARAKAVHNATNPAAKLRLAVRRTHTVHHTASLGIQRGFDVLCTLQARPLRARLTN